MSKRQVFTHITPLPPDVSRRTAVAFLHNHKEMIEMNPLVLRHTPTSPPSNATPDEARNMTWYEITDEIQYIPGTAVKGEAAYKAGFWDLPKGLQTHVFAPGGVDIQAKWSVGGNMPYEEREPVELGISKPLDGLYIREDVDLRCNVFFANFVKRNLKKSHGTAVQKLVKRAQEMERENPQLRRPPSMHSATSETTMKRNSLITSPVPYNQLYVPSGTNLSRNPTPSSMASNLSQKVCSCLGTRHHPACRYFIDIYQQSDNESLRSRNSPPRHSVQLDRTGTWESDPTSATSVRHQTSCFCTGGVHLQGCPSYPGLRLFNRRSVTPPPLNPRDSQQAPYQLAWALNDSSISTPDQPRPSSRGASSFTSRTWITPVVSPGDAYERDQIDLELKPQPLMTRTSHGYATPTELEGDQAVRRYYEYQAQRWAELE